MGGGVWIYSIVTRTYGDDEDVKLSGMGVKEDHGEKIVKGTGARKNFVIFFVIMLVLFFYMELRVY